MKPASWPGTQGLPVCPPPPPFSTPTPSYPMGPCAAVPASPLLRRGWHRALLLSPAVDFVLPGQGHFTEFAPLLSALSYKLFPSVHTLSSGHSTGLGGRGTDGCGGDFKPCFKPSHMLSSNMSFAGGSGEKCCSQSPSQDPLQPLLREVAPGTSDRSWDFQVQSLKTRPSFKARGLLARE